MARYQSWSRHGWVKWVAITDSVTGETGQGRDWQSWEEAQGRALDHLLHKLTREVDREAAELLEGP